MKYKKLLLGIFVLLIFSSFNLLAQINLNSFETEYYGDGKSNIFANISLSPDNYEIKLDIRKDGDINFINYHFEELNITQDLNYILDKNISGLVPNDIYEFKLKVESIEENEFKLFLETLETTKIKTNIFDIEYNTQNIILMLFMLSLFVVLNLIGFYKPLSSLTIIILGFMLMGSNLLIGFLVILLGLIFVFDE